jgi:hypothetical protein
MFLVHFPKKLKCSLSYTKVINDKTGLLYQKVYFIGNLSLLHVYTKFNINSINNK